MPNYLSYANIPAITGSLVKQGQFELGIADLNGFAGNAHGNKWFKLKCHFRQAKEEGKTCLIALGGAYSNYLRALVELNKGFDLKLIIRGDDDAIRTSAQSQKLMDAGARCYFIPRERYDALVSSIDTKNLPFDFDSSRDYILPANEHDGLAIQGCLEIGDWLSGFYTDFDYLFLPVGYGHTLSAVASKMPENIKVIGVSSTADFKQVEGRVNQYLLKQSVKPIEIWSAAEFGGFGRWNAFGKSFLEKMELESLGISLDSVYNAKTLCLLSCLKAEGGLPLNSRVLMLNSGGMSISLQ